MDLTLYSLSELKELNQKIQEKIKELENERIKELFGKIRPLIFTDQEWESLENNQREFYDLYYNFDDERWIGTIGLLELRAHYDYNMETMQVNFSTQGWRTVAERDQMFRKYKLESPLFFKVGKRLQSQELRKIMQQYADLDMISLIDMYSRVNV